jgi:hypothetical protein
MRCRLKVRAGRGPRKASRKCRDWSLPFFLYSSFFFFLILDENLEFQFVSYDASKQNGPNQPAKSTRDISTGPLAHFPITFGISESRSTIGPFASDHESGLYPLCFNSSMEPWRCARLCSPRPAVGAKHLKGARRQLVASFLSGE